MAYSRLLPVAMLAAMLLPNAAAAHTLKSREGRFLIELPAQPERAEVTEAILAEAGPHASARFDAEGWRWSAPRWTVTFLVLPPGLLETPIEQLYRTVLAMQWRAGCDRMLEQRQLRHRGIEGREAAVAVATQSADGKCSEGREVLRTRNFIVGAKFFRIVYRGPRGTEAGPEVTRVFNSFRVDEPNMFAYSLKSAEGNFSIELPDEPERETASVRIKGKELPGLRWSADGWTIVFAQLPRDLGGVTPAGLQSEYERRELGRCGRVQRHAPVRSRDLRGQELIVHSAPWTQRHGCNFRRYVLRIRLFLAGNRYFQLRYRGARGTETKADVTRVMNSFRVMK